MENELVVSVQMITYGHEAYIKQAVESVLMQKTDFEFDLIIADDCSPDTTPEIINEIIKANPKSFRIKYFRHSENIGMQENGIFALSKCMGKYIAICEGDDYWTDPQKLQKQVDFLEANPDYGLVYSKVRNYHQLENKFAFNSWGGDATTFDQLIVRNQIPTLTAVFKNDLLRQYARDIQPELHEWKMGDYPTWLYFALKSKIYFMNEISGIYRVLDESMSHSLSIEKRESFILSFHSIRRFFLEYAKISINDDEMNDALYSSLAANALVMKKRNRAKNYFKQIKKLSTKDKIKYLISYSYILSSIYYLKSLVSTKNSNIIEHDPQMV